MLALDFSEATGDVRDEQRPVTSRNRSEFVGAMAARTPVGARRDALEARSHPWRRGASGVISG